MYLKKNCKMCRNSFRLKAANCKETFLAFVYSIPHTKDKKLENIDFSTTISDQVVLYFMFKD